MRSAQPIALTRRICASSRGPWRTALEVEGVGRMGLQNSNRIQCRSKGYIAGAGDQAHPIDGFYAELLKSPLKKTASATRTTAAPPPPEQLPKTQKEETLEKARIVFGSRLAGPGERRKEIENASKMVAGVLVPPKPTEPDNCCMSGCVNCVWDMYRDEMEEWAEKSAEARAALQAQRAKGQGTGTMVAEKGTPSHVATSMDDDGGGSEAHWGPGMDQERLFHDIPVGIRMFMQTEKKLKKKHQLESKAL